MSTSTLFKPSKPSSRASISTIPSTSTLSTLSTLSNENHSTINNNNNNKNNNNNNNSSSTTLKLKRKRAQSLGGAPPTHTLDDDTTTAKKMKFVDLSPGKLARRTLVPRRSILKSTPSNNDSTATFNFDLQPQPAGGHTTDLSNLSSIPFSRRKSSIAPGPLPTSNNADSDETDDDDDDDDQGKMDMDFTRIEDFDIEERERRKSLASSRRVSFAPNAHIRTFTPEKPTAQAQALLRQQEQLLLDQLASEQQDGDSSFDSSNTSTSNESMDLAQSGDITNAFASHFNPTPFQEEQEQQEDGEEEAEDDEGMEIVNESEVTRAFQLGLGGAKAKPRFSEIVRNEDEDDEAVLRELGLYNARVQAGVVEKEDEDMEEEEEEESRQQVEQTVEMDMTVAVGRIITTSSKNNDDDEDDEEEQEQVQEDDTTSHTQELSFATTDAEGDQITGTIMMEETRIHGSGILSRSLPPPPPLTPAERRLQARRISSIVANEEEEKSGRRGSLGSSRRGLPLPTTTVTSSSSVQMSTITTSILTTKSAILEFPILNSANISPRRKSSSPRKNPSASPTKLSTPSRSRSRSRSQSPTKPPPSMSIGPVGGRSPGGSLSLRGLILKEQFENSQERIFLPPSYLARKSLSPRRSPSRRGEEEKDNTGSSFGTYRGEGEEEAQPQRNINLHQFLEESGTGFMKDILGMTGVDLMNKRRKSMSGFVRSNDENSHTEPPSFADRAVAGGCKTLFYQLYQSDQLRLQEAIQSSMNSLSELDEAIQHDYPEIFEEWVAANEDQKSALIGQFRLIKAYYYLGGRIDWNRMRSENHQAIINVMEENLQGLRADNEIIAQCKFDEVLPALEQRRADLIRELQEERARDEELTNCDQDELRELHAAIVEQNEQLEKHERERAEKAGELATLTESAKEVARLEAEQREKNQALQQVLEEGRCFTKAEVFRLKGEYEALQALHGWHLTRFTATEVTLRHLKEIDVVLTISAGVVDSVNLSFAKPLEVGLEGEVTAFLGGKLNDYANRVLVACKGTGLQPKTIISQIASFWTSSRRLRGEILLMSHRYPTKTNLINNSSILEIIAEVHCPKARATFEVVFDLNGDELEDGDSVGKIVDADKVVRGLSSDLKLKWGPAETELHVYIVRDMVDDLDRRGRGALVEACDAVEREYEK